MFIILSELSIQPSLNNILMPRGLQSSQNQAEGGAAQDGSASGGGTTSDHASDGGNATLPNTSGSAVA